MSISANFIAVIILVWLLMDLLKISNNSLYLYVTIKFTRPCCEHPMP